MMMSRGGDRSLGNVPETDGAVCLGVDGLVFDISNLSAGGSKTGRHVAPAMNYKKERPTLKLYPSAGSVRLKAPSIRDIGHIFKEMESLDVISSSDAPSSSSFAERNHPEPPRRSSVQRTASRELEKNDYQHRAVRSMESEPAPKNPTHAAHALEKDRFELPEARSNRPGLRSEYARVAAKPQARVSVMSDSDDDDANFKQPPTKRIEIEVSPGVFLPMRGADETELAVRRGDVHQTACACCQSLLYCIKAAEYLYCPNCRIIGPVSVYTISSSDSIGGVGLGLTEEAMSDVIAKIHG